MKRSFGCIRINRYYQVNYVIYNTNTFINCYFWFQSGIIKLFRDGFVQKEPG
jgi:hypothetical protein